MNRIVRFGMVGLISLATIAGCGSSSTATTAPSTSGGTSSGAQNLTAGVAIYKFDDTFMTSVRNNITTAAEGKIKVDLVDSQNAQPTQNDQVDLFISKKVSVLAINPVDRAAAGTILDKAKAANIPVVFFNREPLPEDMKKWDKVYYIGTKGEESGTMQGQIALAYWKAHPEADKNKDGKIQYVMLKGEPGHQDAELRTEYAIKALTDGGVEVEKLAEDTGMWDRVKGQEKMAAFIGSQGDKIEMVFGNNDDMALGAIEALKAAGYFKDGKFMPVFGVDATAPALEALKEKTLSGTVLNDAVNQGKATLMVALALAEGKTPDKASTGYDVTDGKYVWVPYKPITLDTIGDAK